MTKIAIICGGPSKGERGISLNSARSIYDHLQDVEAQFWVLYVDLGLNFYKVETSQLYSNTPSDFDFKLAHENCPLTPQERDELLKKCDVVFPAIHGQFGEDGELQKILEKLNVPFVGSSSEACKQAFDKFSINRKVAEHGYPTLDLEALDLEQFDETRYESDPAGERPATEAEEAEDPCVQTIQTFFEKYDSVIIKPNAGGSSVGVKKVSDLTGAKKHLVDLKKKHHVNTAVVEQYCDLNKFKEFTVVVLSNNSDEAVSLVPTQVIGDGKIFDTGSKYLPDDKWRRPCPPRDDDVSESQLMDIRRIAEEVFKVFGMRDLARMDGFLAPDGKIYFNDFNPISGMEQNSFIFQQASRIGWEHGDLLRHLLDRALGRAGKAPVSLVTETDENRSPVWILLGGDTAEKEVSVMSGTNVWLKLKQSKKYTPTPFLFLGENSQEVWRLPHGFCLDHTVAEIEENCRNAEGRGNSVRKIADDVHKRLEIDVIDRTDFWPPPVKMDLESFMQDAIENNAFVFIGLHGGMGENGQLQQLLDQHELNYNGPGSETSQLCMNKLVTGQVISKKNISGVVSAPKYILKKTKDALKQMDAREIWHDAKEQLGLELKQMGARDISINRLLIKPQMDGCSAGIVQLTHSDELKKYIEYAGTREAPGGTFEAHKDPVIMAFDPSEGLLIEPFVKTMKLEVRDKSILVNGKPIETTGTSQNVTIDKGWVELTVGVIQIGSRLEALPPSITIAGTEVLTLAEKFQGGTGVNLTPPAPQIVSQNQVHLIQEKIVEIAAALGIEGYSRIDIFFHTKSEQILVIEANSLPGLTPATVIYHQALARPGAPLVPCAFLEHIISSGAGGQNG